MVAGFGELKWFGKLSEKRKRELLVWNFRQLSLLTLIVLNPDYKEVFDKGMQKIESKNCSFGPGATFRPVSLGTGVFVDGRAVGVSSVYWHLCFIEAFLEQSTKEKEAK